MIAGRAIVEITKRCNLRCRHCYYFDGSLRGPELGTTQWISVFQRLQRLGARRLWLSGGEPLLRHDLLVLLEEARRLGFEVGVATNGTCLTERAVLAMRSMVHLGMQVSLDGLEDYHNWLRRKPCYVQVLRGLSLLDQAVFNYGLQFTATRMNRNALPDVLTIARQYHASWVKVVPVLPNAQTGCNEGMILSPAEISRLYDQLAEAKKTHVGFLDLHHGILSKADLQEKADILREPIWTVSCDGRLFPWVGLGEEWQLAVLTRNSRVNQIRLQRFRQVLDAAFSIALHAATRGPVDYARVVSDAISRRLNGR